MTAESHRFGNVGESRIAYSARRMIANTLQVKDFRIIVLLYPRSYIVRKEQ